LDHPPILDLRLNHLDEPALLRIKDGLIEICWVRNQESFALLGLLVIGNAPQRSNRKRPVGIQQQRIEGRTHHRRIAAVFLKGCCDVLLQFCVGLRQGLSIGTLTTSSVYGGRLAEMSSNETNAPISMRNLPKSNGDAPGRSLTRLVTFALEQAFSWGSMVVMVSRTPYVSVKLRMPASPYS